jgi:hypothetical protein
VSKRRKSAEREIREDRDTYIENQRKKGKNEKNREESLSMLP